MSSCSSRRPTGSSRARRIPARRGRCCPTSASSRRSSARSWTRSSGSAASTSAPVEPIVPAVEQWRYRNKLEYSFGEDADGQLVLGFHPPGSWRQVVDVRGGRARLEPRSTSCARACEDWCARGGAERLRPRDPQRLPPQPRGARGPAHRPAPGAARHEPGRLPRGALRGGRGRAQRRSGRRTASVAEVTRDARDQVLSGERAIEERIGSGLRFRISPDAFFQTNTEMAERLYASRGRVRRADRLRSASSTSSAGSARSA